MVIVDRTWFIWRDRLVFFPTLEEINEITGRLPSNVVVRIHQTSAELSRHPHLIQMRFLNTNCIDLTKDLETIVHEMDAKSCRYEIRRAEKMQANIKIDENNPRAYKDFLRVYNTFGRQSGHAYYLTRLSSLQLRKYLPVSDVRVIYFNDRPICGHLLVRDKSLKRIHLYYSASSRLSSKEDAKLSGPLNRYLHWQEIQSYKHQGFRVYDFGGGGTPSIKDFKLSFGGSQVPEYGYVIAGKLGVLGFRTYKRLIAMSRSKRLEVS